MEDIIPANAEKVSESDQELSELDDQSEALQAKVCRLESSKSGNSEKWRHWCKNMEVPEKVHLLTRLEVEKNKILLLTSVCSPPAGLGHPDICHIVRLHRCHE